MRLVEKRFAILIGSRIELWFVIPNRKPINCFRESFTNWKWVMVISRDIETEMKIEHNNELTWIEEHDAYYLCDSIKDIYLSGNERRKKKEERREKILILF